MARRGRKLTIGLTVTVIVVLVGLVIADRVAAGIAADQVAAQAKKELVAREITSPADPTASIGGFPFLTQVIGGTYQKVTIKVDQPKANDVQLRDLTLVATGVRAKANDVLNGTGSVTADAVTATGNLDWDAIRSQIKIPGLPNVDPKQIELRVVDNKIDAKLPLGLVGGQSATLGATGTVEVEGGKVRVRFTDVNLDDAGLPPLVQTAARRWIQQNQKNMVASINVPAMPYKLVINKVETSDAGVTVIATADNVVMAG